jgi:hypothetical protein
VTALASSLKRIWSAKNRVPHLTGWGTSGSRIEWMQERGLDLTEVVQRNLPVAIIVAWNIFR